MGVMMGRRRIDDANRRADLKAKEAKQRVVEMQAKHGNKPAKAVKPEVQSVDSKGTK